MKAHIKAIEDGPLVLSSDDNHNIIHQDNNTITAGNPAYLCRCGHSKTKPFCDGTHSDVQFQSKREIEKENIQEYVGKDITVNFNRSICAGAANCVKHKEVFSSGSSTNWIHPDNDTNEKIIETIKSCPSGALSYILENGTHIDSRDEAKISIVKNGPYNVQAIEHEFRPVPMNFSTTKYTLCRCGMSKNKPYCDYSHAENNWNDQEE